MKRFDWLVLLSAFYVPQAQAINQEIRALFQPDSSQPSKNVFVNKTANSGYCAEYPDQCADNGMFSIRLPVRFNSTEPIWTYEGVGIKVPANWRRLTVTNTQTMETETVEVRITGAGSRFVLSSPAHELVGVDDVLLGHQRLWTSSSWVYAPSPCQYSGVGAYSPDSYRFFWKTPVEAFCTKVATTIIPSMYFDTLDFAYELRTPNPLGMSAGLYTGSLTYSLGIGGDFDVGPRMRPDDSNLTLDFVLDVQHTLKVDIPPGGDKVVLEPQGGWHRWLDSGRKPARLYRDQIFHISASSKFTMKLECEHRLGFGSGCAIVDGLGFAGAVDVSVSLPNGLTNSAGQPVKRQLLGIEATAPFQPGLYIDRKPATLHFEVNEQQTHWMIDNAQGRPYRGNITVIWDSEVG
ncbi:hypothetical protein NZ35_25235 [Pseudomonas chlororaphis]|uniref:Uncharacterized protein n=1 Tax=Pseudomonas chlororaphis TaxID=587753 RepID=A0A0A6D5P9_9PSED|nr:hypothetical protein NZ35_25235 [Pseudomonas chlororaphis]